MEYIILERNSFNCPIDEDNRKFNPNEVFETVEDAQGTVDFLMTVYENGGGPYCKNVCR